MIFQGSPLDGGVFPIVPKTGGRFNWGRDRKKNARRERQAFGAGGRELAYFLPPQAPSGAGASLLWKFWILSMRNEEMVTVMREKAMRLTGI